MDEQEFRAALARARGAELMTVMREPGGRLGEHTHPFEARAIILNGDITIATAEGARRYLPGDVFYLAAGQPHAEWYGPAGVSYLAGRR